MLSVSPGIDPTTYANDEGLIPVAAESSWGLFYGDGTQQVADLTFHFEGTPTVTDLGNGAIVTLDGAETWVDTGEPVLPVDSTTLLLPQGQRIVDVQIVGVGEVQTLGTGTPLLAAPNAVPFDGEPVDSTDWTTVFDTNIDLDDLVRFNNYTYAGYNLATLSVFPVLYDAAGQVLSYVNDIQLRVTTTAGDEVAVIPQADPVALATVAEMVDNPQALETYTVATTSGAADQYEYVVITGAALADQFQPLLAQKESRGLTTRLVTTEWIAANYQGTENHDLADKIREFIADSYANHGTRWVLLGGDTEIIPVRGVYASVGSTVDYALPTDMYYACLDGPWNGDGDTVWGEANDGIGGGDIDLIPEVYVGRAPVSTTTEAANFVNKTILYETTPHPNATTALLLGEQLDANTYGSYSSIPIRNTAIPQDWNVIEMYDSSGTTWTAAQLVDQLNASPNLVNHLGHSNEVYNARLVNSTVAGLTNPFPFFMYSQGCNAGSIDTHDVSIAEQYVVDDHGAFGVVMNSRYGWYVPGSTPGGSHYYALEFFDAVFNENILHVGQANFDSKMDNLFRVTATGAYRWIHFETNLLGDPETMFQLGDAAPQTGTIAGHVYDDTNGNGRLDDGETGKAGEIVYLDLDNDGYRDQGTTVFESRDTPQSIPDPGTLYSTIDVTGVGTVRDLNVRLYVSHTYLSDLTVSLIGPDGTRVQLFSGIGGSGDNLINTVLDDQAEISINLGSAPFTGSFRPEEALAAFNGKSAEGTWTLEIQDSVSWDQGTLEGWSLEFVDNEPFTVTDATGAYAFDNLPAGDYVVRHEATVGTEDTGSTSGGVAVTLSAGQTIAGIDFYNSDGAVQVVDLGMVDYTALNGVTGDGSVWYRLEASHDGILSVAVTGGSIGTATLRDAQGNAIAASTLSGNTQRLDWIVQQGETFFLELSGGNVDARIANLVSADAQGIVLFGTAGDDHVDLTIGDTVDLVVNGFDYRYTPSDFGGGIHFAFDAGSGADSVDVTVNLDHTATASPSNLYINAGQTTVDMTGVEDITLQGGVGLDVVHLYDSPGNDVFTTRPGEVELTGPGYALRALNYDYAHGYATAGGTDVAHMLDSAGDDSFYAVPDYAIMRGNGFYNRAKHFEYVHGYRSTGNDVAVLDGSNGDDGLTFRPEYAILRGDGYYLRAKNFGNVVVRGWGGNDSAVLMGSSGNDWLTARPGSTTFSGDTFHLTVDRFESIYANAQAGSVDVAMIYDTAGNDVFTARPGYGRLTGTNYSVTVANFEYVHGYGSGGVDVAHLYDSAGNDVFNANPTQGVMRGNGFYLRAKYFDYVHGYAGEGDDTAYLYGSSGADYAYVLSTHTVFRGSGFYNRAKLFEHVYAIGDRHDSGRINDSSSNDKVNVLADRLQIYYPGAMSELRGFASLVAASTNGGHDSRTYLSEPMLDLQWTGSWS
ncbi:C25 family cysteine peptidase [Thermostilla marina]